MIRIKKKFNNEIHKIDYKKYFRTNKKKAKANSRTMSRMAVTPYPKKAQNCLENPNKFKRLHLSYLDLCPKNDLEYI